MVELVDVGKHKLNKETLDLALSEYREFRDSEDYEESYKWEILKELNQWTDNNEITEETVQEFVELLNNKNPATGSLVNYHSFRDVREYAENNPERLAEMLNELFDESQPLEERISNFRSELTLNTDSFAYLLAAKEFKNYAPFKQNIFIDFMENFLDEEELPNVYKMSVAEKYTLFTEYCKEVSKYIAQETDLEASALTGQDFIYTTTTYPQVKNNFKLKYLYRFSQRMSEFRDNPEKIRERLKSLPESFLQSQEEQYRDKDKIGEIRHRIIENVINGDKTDIEELKQEVNQKYDTDILRSWKNFTIMSQIYVNYFKRRTNNYIDSIADELVNKLGEDDLKPKKVGFQGSQNFPTEKCWMAVYPASIDSHRKAYMLSISISSQVKYGLSSGKDIKAKDLPERSIFNKEEEINYTEIVNSLQEQLVEFWEKNGELIEEDDDETDLEEPERFDEIKEQIERNSQLVFYGPVGTGKTYTAQKFARYWVGPEEPEEIANRVETVTFHPSFSYEDFVEGLTAKKKGESVVYEIEDGIFKEMADKARKAYEKADNKSKAPKYVLIIDEINRGNLPKILGETITLLEDDKRLDQDNEVRTQLSHSGERFVIPPNLKIIGTMNTADRSVALVDTAIRRRFRFLRFPPNYNLLMEELGFEGSQELKDTIKEDNDADRVMKALSFLALKEVNKRIINSSNLGKGKQIGHSYLLGKESQESITDVWRYEILPLLEEYFFSQFQRMKTEIFNGKEVSIIDWEKEEIKDFTSEELREAFENLVDIEDEE